MTKSKSKKTKPSPNPTIKSIYEKEENEESGGIFLEQAGILLIYKALRNYQPTKKEENLYGILLEDFEMILEEEDVEISIN